MASVLEVFAPPDGGVAEHVLRLATGVRDAGHHVEAAAMRGAEFVPRLRAAGLEVHELPFRRAVGPADLLAARALRRLVRGRRFDLIHAHSSKAGGIARAALPAPGRIVYTPHCFAFSAGGGRGAAVYRQVERGLLARTGAVVAVSEWERREALRELGAPPGLVRVVPNGVADLAGGTPDPELVAFAGGRPLALMMSVLRPQKDPVALVRAAALLRDAGRLAFRVAIVGNGELRDDVLAAIERHSLADDVRLFPFRGDVRGPLHAADVFVLPSLWESLPIGVLEAMSVGRAVVATAVAGTPEAVQDGVTGRLVAPGSPQALAEALAGVLADEGWRRGAAAAGRRRFEERFRVEAMVAGNLAVYADLTR